MYVVVSLNNWAFFLCTGAVKDNIIFFVVMQRFVQRKEYSCFKKMTMFLYSTLFSVAV